MNDPHQIRDAVLCPKCLKEMPRVTHATKDLYQCVNAACEYRRWHTKTGELAFPLPTDKK